MRRTRRGCPNKQTRRTASYGDADAHPAVPAQLWWQLVELLSARGELDGCARRMAKHLTHHASKRGYVTAMEDTVIPGYKGRYGIGRRSLYTDLGRLAAAGLLRQTRAACPGRPVGYQMCVPQTLPADLPAGLRAKLRKLWARPTKTGQQTLKNATEDAPSRPLPAAEAIRVAMPMAERHHYLSQCEAVRIGGSAQPRATEAAPFRGRLHTSPFLKRALPQPPGHRSRQGPVPRPDRLVVQDLIDEHGLVDEVMARCTALWSAQRPPGGLLDDHAVLRLRPLVRGALRYQASADVVEAMTAGTRTARDLGAVVATRLRRLIDAARRAANLPADDDGSLYDHRTASRAAERAELHTATSNARHQARQALQAAQDRTTRAARPLVPRPRPAGDSTGPGAVEFRRQITELRIRSRTRRS